MINTNIISALEKFLESFSKYAYNNMLIDEETKQHLDQDSQNFLSGMNQKELIHFISLIKGIPLLEENKKEETEKVVLPELGSDEFVDMCQKFFGGNIKMNKDSK